MLNKVLEPYGVVVETVILGDHRFHNEYQKAINDKKVFDQEGMRFARGFGKRGHHGHGHHRHHRG